MSELVKYFEARREQLIELIRSFVEIETPSGDATRIGQLAELVAKHLLELGARVDIITTAGGPSVHALVGASETKPRLLIVGHCDTVWPTGTLARLPFRKADGCLYGPGVFDMKSGIAITLAALGALQQLRRQPARPLELFFSCDEEQGSHSTRAQIEEMARNAHAALVLEPPLPGGRVKTARKGIGQYRLIAQGRAAHAGVAPEKGISAVEELSHQVIKLHSLTDHARGISVNVGVIAGGTMSNVVAAEASAEIDVRFWTQADEAHIVTALNSLKPVLPGAQIKVNGYVNRPPLERSPGIVELYQHARTLAHELGFELNEGKTGGGSDGNFIAAIGTPVLDGLGPDGDGAHAEYEHVLIDNLAPRAALITRLLETL
ncbi:MAG: M20 family metallopeptidase [Acidobacteriota bacterium]